MNTCVVLVRNILNACVLNYDLYVLPVQLGMFYKERRCIFVVVVVAAAAAAAAFAIAVFVVVLLLLTVTEQEEASQRCCSQAYELYVAFGPISTTSSVRQPDLDNV